MRPGHSYTYSVVAQSWLRRSAPAQATSARTIAPIPTRLTADMVFFFQAEDGIRHRDVTGVQTCALPIYAGIRPAAQQPAGLGEFGGGTIQIALERSEERRVGKEGRSRWWRYH